MLSSPQGTHSGVVCRGLPPWRGRWGRGEGPGGRAVQLGKSKGGIGPRLAADSGCLRAQVPRPLRVMGAPSAGAPGWGVGKAGTGDSRCPAIRQPRLGPTPITGCLSDPGRLTLTSPGLSFYNQ